jgi:outer membrane protein
MKKTWIPLLLLALLAPCGYAQETLTFEMALAMALKKNHQVAIARNNLQIVKNEIHIGNAGLLPQLDLTAGTDYQTSTPPGESVSRDTTNRINISASYTVFDGLSNVNRYRTLQSQGISGELDTRDLIETTLLQVGGAYYEAARAYESLLIARELLAISIERLERAEKRSLYGRARTIDVLSAQVDKIADEVTVTQAEFNWQNARRDLNVLLNRDIQHRFKVETDVGGFRNFDLGNLKTEALSRNAAYLSMLETLNQFKLNLTIARANLLPRLSLTASYGWQQMNSDWNLGMADPTTTFQLGAQFSFNIFRGFQDSIAIKNARLAVQNQEIATGQVRLELEKDVTGEYESFRNSLLILELQKKYVEAAELNFRRTQELYQLGQVTTTQFREAQINLIQSRYNLAAAKFDAKINEIGLLKLSGRLLDMAGAGGVEMAEN